MVPKTNAVPLGGRRKKIKRHVELLPESAWSEAHVAFDGGGRRPWEWACLDLAPDLEKAQRGGVGRPRLDHCADLGGIFGVARTGSSWREMTEEEYGKWETAYRRHELWAKQGLWQRIFRALGEEDLPGPATKKPN